MLLNDKTPYITYLEYADVVKSNITFLVRIAVLLRYGLLL